MESNLDEEHFQHVIYGINKILLVLRDGGGLNKNTIIKGGKVLFRMARIIQAYVHKKNKENIPAEEFAKRMVEVVDTAYGIFVGGVIPRVW
ncbi:MAG: hypothetical protein KAS32_10300 [Candidatus Peribacteraceae bacterium]|nr:hypothetical protein [Candidatus Peribacteraceae bacterium]